MAAETQGPEEERGQLISPEVNNAVHAAFNALAQTVLVHNARTLEDMLRETLRPMLKAWLDDNLPGMVERLVRVEIERVSPPPRRVSIPKPELAGSPHSIEQATTSANAA
jgi:cell pole-organizing protein PopZ